MRNFILNEKIDGIRFKYKDSVFIDVQGFDEGNFYRFFENINNNPLDETISHTKLYNNDKSYMDYIKDFFFRMMKMN